MRLIIWANENSKEELGTTISGQDLELTWVNSAAELMSYSSADAYLNLQPADPAIHAQLVESLRTGLYIFNDVTGELPVSDFSVRINGWNTFLKRTIIEATTINEKLKPLAETVFARFDKKVEWLPGIAGFISARIVAMIINEAYFSLEEKVSTREEIDIAMKTGTNYPYGPFEWSQKIGLKNIYSLLVSLARQDEKYIPCDTLKNEALKA